MTPEREAYLTKCSKLEMYLRNRFREAKISLKTLKTLTAAPVNKEWLKMIRFVKLEINIIRHELNRLKGMARVVVPNDVHITYLGFGQVGKCTCGNWVTQQDNYCSRCGRRILWKKVK